jgi:hypothetical protein
MIQNKVAESELITIDLKIFLPKNKPLLFDIKPFLFRELIIKEKEFRTQLQTHDWNQYTGNTVLINCSIDAIVPVWAYMLITVYLNTKASEISFETEEQWVLRKTLSSIENVDLSSFTDKRIVIKGCGDEKIPDAAYVAITNKLLPVTKSIMYGEPCSTVPIYKQKK